MRDPFSWSFPIGRLFGIVVRVHFLFPLVALGLVLRVAFDKDAAAGVWVDATMVVALLFFSVLLHEFGHCFAARRVGGDAQEVLLWPLGGLAAVDAPHTPRANFVTAAGGPAVNLLLCGVCALILIFALPVPVQPPLNPFWRPIFIDVPGVVALTGWDGHPLSWARLSPNWQLITVLVARLFWVNWFMFLLNVVLIGFPLDGGRMFQCILWKYVGYRQATLYAIYAGFVTMFVVIVFSFVVNEVLPLCLAGFIYVSCKQQWLALEAGGEESLFGYDFSQGYTSLERDQPPPPKRKKVNFIQRWLQRRAARKLQKEQERLAAEERRMDELLEKIQQHGKQSLTDEEHRFLKRVADKYRNRP